MHNPSVATSLHPHQLSTIATVRGLSPLCAWTARICLYGLRDPSDLIAFAAYLPEAKLVAIDDSESRIAATKHLLEELGLDDAVRLELQDSSELLADLGPFDFILIRDLLGRYDWDRRKALLMSCAQALSEDGLVALGYPCLPGWQPMSDFAAWLRARISPMLDDSKRVAALRKFLTPLAPLSSTNEAQDPALGALHTLAAALSELDDDALLDQVLDPNLRGLSLAAVVDETSSAGLHYVGDADRQPGATRLVHRLVQKLGDAFTSLADAESLADLTMPRGRRTSVFAKTKAPGGAAEAAMMNFEARLVALRFPPKSGQLDLESEQETFVGPYGATIDVTSRLARSTLALLTETWPRAIPTALAVETAADALAAANPSWALEVDTNSVGETKELLAELCELGLADLRTEPLPIANQLEPKPRIHDLVRRQCGDGTSSAWVTSPLHVDVELSRFLVELGLLLDGEHDADALESSLSQALEDGRLELEQDGQVPTDPVTRKHLLRSRIIEGLSQLQVLGLLARSDV